MGSKAGQRDQGHCDLCSFLFRPSHGRPGLSAQDRQVQAHTECRRQPLFLRTEPSI